MPAPAPLAPAAPHITQGTQDTQEGAAGSFPLTGDCCRCVVEGDAVALPPEGIGAEL